MCSLKQGEVPADLVCPYCKERQIELIEIAHDEQGVFFGACCGNVDCKLKLIDGRKPWQVGVIRPINYAEMHASSISKKDRQEIANKFPSLAEILSDRKKPRKRGKETKQTLRQCATYVFYTQPD